MTGERSDSTPPDTDTAKIDTGEATARLSPKESIEPGTPTATTWRNYLIGAGWVDAAAVAGLAWLALLSVAAVMLLAPKFQYPGFAKGADPVQIFTGIVIVALASLRVPIHIGELTLSALPLGALVAFAVTIGWVTRGAFHDTAGGGRDVPMRAVKVGAIFALVAMLMALIFRFRGKEPVFAGAPSALFFGFVWATSFVTLALARKRSSWRAWAAGWVERLRQSTETTSRGVFTGGVMLAVSTVLAAAALLLAIIGGLAGGAPYGEFGWGDAIAALLYLAAFLPNLLVAIVVFSLGAPIFRGAQVGFGGELIGRIQEVSLLDWPRGAPWFAYLLLAIPLVACGTGGWWAGRERRESLWKVLGIAAIVFALSLALLGWLGEARLGAGLVRQRGLAVISISPLRTFLWAGLWALVAGWLGAEIAQRGAGRSASRLKEAD